MQPIIGASTTDTIVIWVVFIVVAVLLMCFVWIPTIRRRNRLSDSLSDFLDSQKNKDNIKKD